MSLEKTNPFQIQAPSVSAKAPLLEDGYYNSRVVAISDCGMQDNFNKDGKVHKVRVFFALNESYDFKEEKSNYVFSKQFTSSLHAKSSLRKMVDEIIKVFKEEKRPNIDKDGFDLTKLIGLPLRLNIERKESSTDSSKEYNNIISFKKAVTNKVDLKRVFITKFFVEEALAWRNDDIVEFWDPSMSSSEDEEEDGMDFSGSDETPSQGADEESLDIGDVLNDM